MSRLPAVLAVLTPLLIGCGGEEEPQPDNADNSETAVVNATPDDCSGDQVFSVSQCEGRDNPVGECRQRCETDEDCGGGDFCLAGGCGEFCRTSQ